METDTPKRGRGVARTGDNDKPADNPTIAPIGESPIASDEHPLGAKLRPPEATSSVAQAKLADRTEIDGEDGSGETLQAAVPMVEPLAAEAEASSIPRTHAAGTAVVPDAEAQAILAAPPVPSRTATRRVPWFHFDDKVGRLVLSAVLAILLWLYVSSLDTQTTQFTDLTVDVRGVGTSLKATVDPTTVNCAVQAPQNVLSTLSKADIRPYVDLTGLSEGVHTVPVHAEVFNPRSSDINLTFNPAGVQVQLELQASRVLSVAIQTLGTPAFGFGTESAQVDPQQVKVTGPTDAVARISKLVVQVDIDGRSGTQQGSKAPTALDSNNQEIKGLTFDPPTVKVTVPMKLLLNYKVVPVRAPVIGQPAPGYRVSAINVDPTNVTVCCSPTLLEPLQSVSAEPVAITGTTSTVVSTTNLILPKGIELYPGQPKQISVTVDVEVMETKFQVSVATSFEGLQPGWSAIASPDKLDLTLAGTFEQSQNLNPADMRAVLDLTGKGAGTFQIKPQVIVPQGIKLDLASPDTITVTLVAPTPSPTATSSPEPTRTTTPTREVVTTLPTPVPTRSPQSEPSATVPTVAATPTGTPTHTPTPQTPGAP